MAFNLYKLNTKEKFFVNSGMKIEVNIDIVLYDADNDTVRLVNKFTGTPTPTKFSPQRVFESKLVQRERKAFISALVPIEKQSIKHLNLYDEEGNISFH
jgi:hypothetical protein